MVIRQVAVSDQMNLPEFNDISIFRRGQRRRKSQLVWVVVALRYPSFAAVQLATG